MARTAVTVNQLTLNAVANPTGVAFDTTNNHYIDTDGRTRALLIHFHVTGAQGTVTFVAPVTSTDQPYGHRTPSWRAIMGDASVVLPGTADRMVCVESARFVQPTTSTYGTGAIFMDTPSPLAGTIYVYRLPVDL